MGPKVLVTIALVGLLFAAISFKLTADDSNNWLIGLLGAIGLFTWLPLLIAAGIWALVRSRKRK